MPLFDRGAADVRLAIQVPDFLGVQGRTNPAVVLAFRQEMPDQHRELASDGDGCDVIAALGADAFIECA